MEQELIFALDIGTRSIIGVVGKVEAERFKVLAIETEEHGKRTMMDGQIQDIAQVAKVAKTVTCRLEEKMGCPLTNVCVAAAGRALCTERGKFILKLPQAQRIDDDLISRLEAGAVSEAELALAGDTESDRQFFLVGYTVSQYQLDHYPLTTLKDHTGRELEAEVVATFLPSEVVGSLYTAMQLAGLSVVSLTLEPIAALNATIPAELRLLNLVLADIGAGTSDIAVCRDGSVVGYTMATVAGDEITEALMKAYLVDFKTAERLKMQLTGEELLCFRDILGLEQRITPQEARDTLIEPTRLLAQEITQQVLKVNGGVPSALFLAGGGSRLEGLREIMADCIGMPLTRVAIAGGNYEISAFSEEYDLNNPEYATPLGIAVSAGLGLINDSYRVMLNGQPAKLFRSGSLTALDILMMNGYTYQDMIGRTGKSMSLTVNGKRTVFRGDPAEPSQLYLNGTEIPVTAVVHAGDEIKFLPARHGATPIKTVRELLGVEYVGQVFLNGVEATLDTPLHSGDQIRTESPRIVERAKPAPDRAAPTASTPPFTESQTLPMRNFLLNGKPLLLPAKPNGEAYFLMDLLCHSGLDFDHLERPVTLFVNGQSGYFTQVLYDNDIVEIQLEGPQNSRE